MPGPFGGGMPNLGKLMKEAQQMGDKIKKIEEELQNTEVDASSGGGMVTATVTASMNPEIVRLKIAPEVVDPEDVEMLEDLVMTALREALENAQTIREEKMGNVAGGFGGSGLPGLPF